MNRQERRAVENGRASWLKRDTYSPTMKAEAQAQRSALPPRMFTQNPTHHGRTPMKAHACPALIFATHPDASVRALAEEQAKEMHDLNDYMAHGEVHAGRCSAKRCRPTRVNLPLSMFAKNDHTMRIALGMKRQARIKARGW